jgi:SAM-dependent methyltransferase
MRFSHKLRKLVSGAGIKSAKRHTHRFFSQRRAPLRFDPEGIMKTIDREKFEAIRARYAVENPGEAPPKYLDWRFWLEANLARIRNLDLDRGQRRSVLDIGSGSGYFLYLCRLLGHDALGIDIEKKTMFTEMIKLLGVERVTWQIQPFVPLPDLKRKFDVITAYMICFNKHGSTDPWGVPEWNFFLNDLARYLSPGGRVWLELNREPDGTCYTPELKRFFESRGAEVVSRRVVFNSTLRVPAATAPAAR